VRGRCGEPGGEGAASDRLQFGSRLRAYRRLKQHVDEMLPLPAEPGGLYAPAFVHLVSGQRGVSDRYTQYVERELVRRGPLVMNFDDVAAALDWCWEALDPKVRMEAARRLLSGLAALTEEDSPFEHVLFHPKLCHLAAANALRDVWPAGSAEAARVEQVVEAGRRWFEQALPPVLTVLRGTAPAPSMRADFEADVVFAVELWRGLNPAAWNHVGQSLRDGLDAYFWSDTEWPGQSTGVLYDTGSHSSLMPGEGGSALAPGVPWVLAHRTGSAVAAWYADLLGRVETVGTLRDAQRAWLSIVHDTSGVERAERSRSPRARVLGNGYVLMRSDWRPGATLVAFDAGQPHWLPRQHLDTGQFQVFRRGRLALDSGDDVLVEAIGPRGGEQGIGDSAGDFDLYARSTVAHNCIVLIHPRGPTARIGGRAMPRGDQTTPAPPRFRAAAGAATPPYSETGRLTAFRCTERYSYAAGDVAKSYGVEAALLADRSILFLFDGLLLVIDRIETGGPEVRASWVLHVPERPTIGGEPLDPRLRRRAEGAEGGSWVYPPGDAWVETRAGGGRLFVRTLLPEKRRVHFIGGPGRMDTVTRGAFSGLEYLGSGPRGFEYWCTPASVDGGANAWYRLGSPVSIGPAFGSGAGWGRMEVEALGDETGRMFVHVLAAVDREQERPPAMDVRPAGEGIEVVTTLRGRTYRVRLTGDPEGPGEIEIVDPLTRETEVTALPGGVEGP